HEHDASRKRPSGGSSKVPRRSRLRRKRSSTKRCSSHTAKNRKGHSLDRRATSIRNNERLARRSPRGQDQVTNHKTACRRQRTNTFLVFVSGLDPRVRPQLDEWQLSDLCGEFPGQGQISTIQHARRGHGIGASRNRLAGDSTKTQYTGNPRQGGRTGLFQEPL